MNRFGLIFKHYLKRNFKTMENIGAMLLLPIGIILLFAFINDYQLADDEYRNAIFRGYNLLHTGLVISNMLFFQVFGLFFSMENLHESMKTPAKWRLMAAPINRFVYPAASILASWVVTIASGVIVVIVTSVVLNVYWGNMFINILALLGISLFAQALGVIIFLITKTVGQGNAIAYPLSFFIGGLSGFIIPIRDFLDNGFTEFLERWSPLNLAIDSIRHGGSFGTAHLVTGLYSGGNMTYAMQNILYLFAIAIGLSLMAFVIGKVKKAW